MQDVAYSLAVIIIGFVLVAAASGLSPSRERSYVLLALGAHFALSIAMYWIMENVFLSSDVHFYVDEGVRLKPLIERDPVRWITELMKLVMRLPNDTPLESDPTERMVAIAAIGMYMTESVWALFLFCTILSFLGKWAIYAAFRDELELEDTRPLLFSTLLIPSCVYWTSGLVKEAFAIAGIGALFRGTQLLLRRLSLSGAALVVVGFALVGGFKPFFLFAFVIGAAMWILFAKVRRDLIALAPFFIVLGLGLAVAGVAILGAQFKEFAVDRLVETVADHQLYGREAEGGSNFQMGDPNARSVAGQLAFAPLALITTLTRPLPFEVHNITSGIACAELLVMTFLLLHSVRRSGLSAAWSNIFGRPALVFALIFTVAAATAVGLATLNFGTLSRYRTPVLPFYATLIVGLRYAARRADSKEESPAPEPPRGVPVTRRRKRGPLTIPAVVRPVGSREG